MFDMISPAGYPQQLRLWRIAKSTSALFFFPSIYNSGVAAQSGACSPGNEAGQGSSAIAEFSAEQADEEDSEVHSTLILIISNHDRLGAVEKEDFSRLNPLLDIVQIHYFTQYHIMTWSAVRDLGPEDRPERQTSFIQVQGMYIPVHIDNLRSLPRLYAMFVVDEGEYNLCIFLDDVSLNAFWIVVLVAHVINGYATNDRYFYSRFNARDYFEALQLVDTWGGIQEISDEITRLFCHNA
ncbi:hypothetical protein F5Y06DRAFT_296022 [Hypoxylon sp. FL0890]|nr:hypothetical protein F5Y06DRAFT_296022 [Hypoxylon sp. FL0890]